MMKKTLSVLMLSTVLSGSVCANTSNNVVQATVQTASEQLGARMPAPNIAATAYWVQDLQSGQIIATQNPDSQVEPASLTKLMTAYLTFKALQSGQLKSEQQLTVSQYGWKAEGSRMFLDPKYPATVNELLQGLIVQSGNDAAITLAEAIGGSESGFTQLMNEEAVRLGMKDTHFENSTGLPGASHLTTVRDLAILSAAIIRDFPDYYKIYSQKSFTYNKITQPNRNLLLYRDPNVDGMKTGYTSSAGYNLISSSHRNGRRVLSVVVGTASAEARAAESSKLLNYALQQFDTPKIYQAGQVVETVQVYKGTEKTVPIGFTQDTYVTVAHGRIKELQFLLETNQPVVAPIEQGQVLGKLTVKDGEHVVATYPVVALGNVDEGGWFRRFWDSIILFFKNMFAD